MNVEHKPYFFPTMGVKRGKNFYNNFRENYSYATLSLKEISTNSKCFQSKVPTTFETKSIFEFENNITLMALCLPQILIAIDEEAAQAGATPEAPWQLEQRRRASLKTLRQCCKCFNFVIEKSRELIVAHWLAANLRSTFFFVELSKEKRADLLNTLHYFASVEAKHRLVVCTFQRRLNYRNRVQFGYWVSQQHNTFFSLDMFKAENRETLLRMIEMFEQQHLFYRNVEHVKKFILTKINENK